MPYVSSLNKLPTVKTLFGLDLRTGTLIIAIISIMHPIAYGCTLFMPMSLIVLTVWILVALFLTASVTLLVGLINSNPLLCEIWILYTLIFVGLMLFLMILFAIMFALRGQGGKVLITILGIFYYILTLYFVFVVNSYRRSISKIDKPKT